MLSPVATMANGFSDCMKSVTTPETSATIASATLASSAKLACPPLRPSGVHASSLCVGLEELVNRGNRRSGLGEFTADRVRPEDHCCIARE